MKKTVLLVIVIATLLFIGCYAALDMLFPKAPDIPCPPSEDVISVSVSKITSVSVTETIKSYDKLLEALSLSTPTRKMSVNDYPTTSSYYTLEITTLNKSLCYYIYEEGSQAYVELPYESIYKASPELVELLQNQFKKPDNTIKVTQNSVSPVGRGEFQFPVEISEDDANTLSEIFDAACWSEESLDSENDWAVNLGGNLIYYNSASGALSKYNLAELSVYSSTVEEINQTSAVLDEKSRVCVNTLLEKYVSLYEDQSAN